MDRLPVLNIYTHLRPPRLQYQLLSLFSHPVYSHMAFSLPLAAFVAAFAYILWGFLRHFVVRSSLDNLSGPAPDYWIMGMWYIAHVSRPSLTVLLQGASVRPSSDKAGGGGKISTTPMALRMQLPVCLGCV